MKPLWEETNTISAALLAEQMENAPVFAGREHLHMEPYEVQSYLNRLWDAKNKRIKQLVQEGESRGEEASDEESLDEELSSGEEKGQCLACMKNHSQESLLTCGNADCMDTYHKVCLAEDEQPVENEVWMCPNCK